MVHVNDLPEEILEHILCFISPYEDLKCCRLVCHRWYKTCLGVVKKRKSHFMQSLKMGSINWFSPNIGTNPSTITRRYSHSSCIYDSSMFVFGGCTATNTTFNDLWKFNLNTYKWNRLLTTGTYPSPKAYASMVTWQNNLILFGGWTHPSVYPLHQQWVLFSELHMYDILSNRWTQHYYEGCPPPTAGHTSTVHGDIVIIFGGLQRKEGLSSSTNDLYCLNVSTERWFKPNISDVQPQPRYGHSQIKLDERHILVMAGCGGSNKLYSDIWLLTLPNNFQVSSETWQWTPITIEGTENVPTQMWYNPACKVGDKIIVLSTWNCPNSGSSPHNKMHQIFIPGSVRRQSANNLWLPQPIQQIPELYQMDRVVPNYNIDVNINGQRGSFRPVPSGDASTSSESEDNAEGGATSSRVRAKPSIRPNASCDRERRLEMLSKMELKIKKIRMNSNVNNKAGTSKTKTTVSTEPNNCLVPHLLDIRNILSTHKVSWQPVSLNKEGIPPFTGNPPQSCLLYTLLLGRGHLLMFGGIPNDPTGSNNHEAVSNDITFISSSSYLDTNL